MLEAKNVSYGSAWAGDKNIKLQKELKKKKKKQKNPPQKPKSRKFKLKDSTVSQVH